MIRRLIARVRAWRRHPDLLTDVLRDRIDGVDRHAASSTTTSGSVDFALWEAECRTRRVARLVNQLPRESR